MSIGSKCFQLALPRTEPADIPQLVISATPRKYPECASAGKCWVLDLDRVNQKEHFDSIFKLHVRIRG